MFGPVVWYGYLCANKYFLFIFIIAIIILIQLPFLFQLCLATHISGRGLWSSIICFPLCLHKYYFFTELLKQTQHAIYTFIWQNVQKEFLRWILLQIQVLFFCIFFCYYYSPVFPYVYFFYLHGNMQNKILSEVIILFKEYWFLVVYFSALWIFFFVIWNMETSLQNKQFWPLPLVFDSVLTTLIHSRHLEQASNRNTWQLLP